MAEQQKADTPPTEGQTQQARGGRSPGRAASGGTNTENAPSGGISSGTGQSAQQGSDQERQRQVSREPGSSSGTGMQRGGSRQSSGGALSSRGGQPSLLPAFMTNPGLMASAFMSNPFAFAQAMSQEMDRLFDTMGGTSESGRGISSGGSGRGLQQQSGQQMGLQGGRGISSWSPPMEVFQRGNDLVVHADLPGMSPEDVQIDIEDGVLTISGERRQSNENREEGFYRSERSYGSFARSIALPEGVDEDQVNARYEHGVLEVTVPLPQQQRQRGRRVQIQGGTSAGQQRVAQGAGQHDAGQQSARQQGSSAQRASGRSEEGGSTASR
jgi:HSP20 family protein